MLIFFETQSAVKEKKVRDGARGEGGWGGERERGGGGGVCVRAR